MSAMPRRSDVPSTTTSLVTWIARAATCIDTPTGKTVYIDPWLDGNPRLAGEVVELPRGGAWRGRGRS
jgi:L-ascorbate metabolism protein UlaG (beta-lactamase superfamily)